MAKYTYLLIYFGFPGYQLWSAKVKFLSVSLVDSSTG